MQKINFNNNWKVKEVSSNLTEQVMGSGNEAKERYVTLPYDPTIFKHRDEKAVSGASTGFYPSADYEYEKKFYVDEKDRDETFILEFEGIFNRGYIYVNGTFAGASHNPYTGCRVDITPFLQYGADNNVMVKAVNADGPNSRWYTGSGLYRPVNLYKGGSVRIQPEGVRISTPEISEDTAAVKTEIRVCYDGKNQKRIMLLTEIMDPSGNKVAEEYSQMSLFEKAETCQTQRIFVRNPQLWSVDTPYLYTCKVSVLEEDTVVDETALSFGIRSLKADPVKGFQVNNETVLLRGGCIHHDNGPIGAASFAWAEERRVRRLKEAGFNSIRVAHNTASVQLLDACDRLGMLVVDETFDQWNFAKSQFDYSLMFHEYWERDLEAVVEKDFNHPSVIMYSIGNEIVELSTPGGAKWNRRLAEKVRQEDPTRFVTNAANGVNAVGDKLPQVMTELGMITPEQLTSQTSNSGGINDIMTALLGRVNYVSKHPMIEENLKEVYGALDIIGMNYMRDAYDLMKEHSNRIFYGSETCPPDIDLNWEKVKDIPACIGDYCWTAWDYIGEAGVGIVTYDNCLSFLKKYPAYLAYCGDIDITGFRRPMSYYRELAFGKRKAPYISVQLPEYYGIKPMCTPWTRPTSVSSWIWKGFEGKRCLVEVYSDATEVELFVNDKSLGKKPAGKENRYIAEYDTVYEPGTVKATAYYENGKTETYMLCTAAEERKISVSVDRKEVPVNDIAYIDIEITDEKGILHTDQNIKIQMNVEGEGTLLAFGSADPYSKEDFSESAVTTYYGRALAVVRAGSREGSIQVKVSADGIQEKNLVLQVKNSVTA